jgi:modulator of drug activity B
MSHVLIINGHEPYPRSPGRLNSHLVEVARRALVGMGHSVEVVATNGDYDIDAEVDRHVRADTVIVQSPVNWMGFPWSCKRYMDYVYLAGMDGRLCTGDGRSRNDPARQYGSGGTCGGKTYMLSLTFNAPPEAFGDAGQYLFQGRTVDDLFFPAHMNFRFLGMTGLPTFVSYDVIKNPDVARDVARYEAHLASAFGMAATSGA